jgi:hypothetical protein
VDRAVTQRALVAVCLNALLHARVLVPVGVLVPLPDTQYN